MDVVNVKYEHVIQEFNDIIKKEKKKKVTHKFVVINEEELIRQVEIRPILYDKSLKGYRKSALRNQCWKEIAASVNCTVEECRKRWRSLRDAFAKHYKQFDGTMSSKKKKWIFYDQMNFIASYLDCANTTMQVSRNLPQLQDNSHESMLINENEQFESAEGNDADYKPHEPVSSGIEHIDIHHSTHNDEHHQEDPTTTTTTAMIDLNDDHNQFVARIFATAPSSAVDYDTVTTAVSAPPVTTTTSLNSLTAKCIKRKSTAENNIEAIISDRAEEYNVINAIITDADERFLLSCAPILKRLSNKKNALARLKIQQILFTIEFDEH